MKNIKAHIEFIYSKYLKLFGAMLLVAILGSSQAMSIPAVNLGSTSNFVILAGSTVTGIPPVTITGNVGLSPAAGSYVVGFSGANVNGILYVVDASGPAGSVVNATLLQTAKSDLTIAYNDAAGRTPVPTGTYLNPGSGNIGGLNLVPGLYKFTSACGITGSDLTLTGSATDVWIFQIGSSLNVGSGIKIILAGGAQAANVYWQVGTSATLGTYSVFKGTIMADQSISLSTGASIEGRCLAFTGAVTMGGGVTTTKAILSFPEFLAIPDSLNFGTVAVGITKMDSILVKNVGTGNLVITGVTSSNLKFSISPLMGTIAGGDSMKYYISYAPLTTLPDTSKFIFSHNGTPNKDTIIVTGNPPFGDYSILPDSLNFGNVTTGLTKLDSVTVTNNGTTNLIVSSVTSNNLSFTVTPLLGTILPGTSQKYYVTFAPLTNGLKNGKIIFMHNASLIPDTVIVNGTGVSSAILISPNHIDFGNVITGQTKLDSVTVTNNGTANLIVTNVTSSNASFTVTPLLGTILPGGSQKYYVTFAPLTDGLKTGNIAFYHNGAVTPELVTLSGTGVSSMFSINPTNLSFGNVNNGFTKKDSVTVTNTGTSNLIITNVTSSNSLFTVTPIFGTIVPGGSQKYYITFAPLTDGLKSGIISFTHNASATPAVVTVNGTGVSTSFLVNPSSLAFGDVITGQNKKDSVTVTNTGTANLVITSVTSSNASFTVTPLLGTIAPGLSQKFYITFAPLTDGLKSGNISFTHNASAVPSVVTVTGTGVSTAITVNPNNLDFGNVINGLTKLDSVTITNSGTSNLIISNVTSSNALFTVTPSTGTIVPGGTQKFYVTFAPLTNGLKTGNISFIHNGSGSPTIVPVTGTGVSSAFSVNPNSLAFGNVITGSNKLDSVTVTNTGTSNLIISNVTSSNALFTAYPLTGTILPGGTLKIYVTFAPLTDGLKTGNISIYHNGTVSPAVIPVTGTGVSSMFSLLPNGLSFGDVRTGLTEMDSVTVTNSGSSNLIITSITSSNPLFSITPLNGIIAPGASKKFYVTFAPLTTGLKTGYFNFYHNASVTPSVLTVNGTGVAPLFALNPTYINFGEVTTGTSKMDSITVTNTGTSNLIITNVTSSNGSFIVTPSIATITPGNSKKFYVVFTPLTDGLKSGTITFVNNATILNNTVSVVGTGLGIPLEPVFSTNPISLNYGNVNVGTTKMDSITVTNTGTANLIITNVSSSNFSYHVTPLNGTIAPGASKKFYVTFAPTTNGIKNSNIVFANNTTSGTNTVTATGVGVSPILSITPMSLDFGTVNVDSYKLDSITVTNLGNANLIITNVTSSNFSYVISPTSIVIAPGASKVFHVTFYPISRGQIDANIIFENNATTAGNVVTATGFGYGVDLIPGFSVSPRVIDFGTVTTGTSKTDSVTVTNTGTANLIITNVYSTYIKFTVTPKNIVIAPGASYKFYITFSPSRNGLQGANIVFENNATNVDNIVIVKGNGSGINYEPIFTAIPDSLDFGNVMVGTTVKDSIRVTNTGNENLIIAKITGSNFSVLITPITGDIKPSEGTIVPGGSKVFYIEFTPITTGPKYAEIYFENNTIIGNNIVYIKGNGIDDNLSPEFTAYPTSLDFGSVDVGNSRQKSVIVTNTGTSNLYISNVVVSKTEYAVTPISASIAPNESVEFFVIFEPTQAGIVNGEIQFTHNLGVNFIPVTGKGVMNLQVITIDEAIDLPIGTEFIVEGIVTRSLGKFTRIQDATGAITILQESGMFFDDVKNFDIQMGDFIRVQGKISEYNSLKVINGSDLTEHQRLSRSNALPTAVTLTLAQLAANPENYESRLIKIENLNIASLGETTYQNVKTYNITDVTDFSNTIVLRIGEYEDTDMAGKLIYQTSVTFEGVLNQSSQFNPSLGYQIFPVLPTDLLYVPTGVPNAVVSSPISLADNYPNPFSSTTTIKYSIAEAGYVTLKVTNVLGNEIAVLVNEFKNAGNYSVMFTTADYAESLSSGLYYYSLVVGKHSSTKKMTLVK